MNYVITDVTKCHYVTSRHVTSQNVITTKTHVTFPAVNLYNAYYYITKQNGLKQV